MQHDERQWDFARVLVRYAYDARVGDGGVLQQMPLELDRMTCESANVHSRVAEARFVARIWDEIRYLATGP